jgi:hypothetical protein
MHIHPFSSNAAGENATFQVFGDQVGLSFGQEAFTLPTGEEFKNGDDCGDGKGVVRVLHWEAGKYDEDPEVIDSNFGDIRFTGDGDAWTIFFGPESKLDNPADLLPPSLSTINQVSDLSPGETTPTFAVPESLSVPSTTGTTGSTTSAPDGGSTTSAPATTAPETTATTG